MAISIDKLIDINLLEHYNNNVKEWVTTTLNEKTSGLELTKKEELPEIGEVDRVYIVEDAILAWNEETQEYEPMGGSDNKPTWGTF